MQTYCPRSPRWPWLRAREVDDEREDAPITLPSREVQWERLRVLKKNVDDLGGLVRVARADLVRLQGDLTGHITHTYDDLDLLRGSVRHAAEAVTQLEADMQAKAIQPLTDIRLMIAEAKGSWRVMVVAGSALGGLAGTVIGGFILWKLTVGP